MKTQSLFFRSASVWLDTGAAGGEGERFLIVSFITAEAQTLKRVEQKQAAYLLV